MRGSSPEECVEQEFSEVRGSNLRVPTPRDGEYRLANATKCSHTGECFFKESEEA